MQTMREVVDGFMNLPVDSGAASVGREVVTAIDAEWASVLSEQELSTLALVLRVGVQRQLISSDNGLQLTLASYAIGREFGGRAERLEG